MKVDARRYEILGLIEKYGNVKINDIAKLFNVTEMTIRRDIKRLSSLGLINSVRGGAENSNKEGNLLFNITLRGRTMENVEEKRRIGTKAAEFVKEGQFIFIKGGTTTLELSKRLPKDINLTVITDSNPISSITGFNDRIKTICTGGEYNRFSETFCGPSAEAFLDNIQIDVLFIGASGITMDWELTEFDFDIASLNKKIIKASNFKILVADSHKFNIKRHIIFGNIKDFDILITDSGIDPEIHKKLEKNDVKIIVV